MTQDNSFGAIGDKPWLNLPATEKDEDEQDFGLPEDEEDAEEEVAEEAEESEEVQEADEEEEDEQQYNLPGVPGTYDGYSEAELMDEFSEDQAPAGFKQLFAPRTDEDLAKLTETPAKMVLPLVRAKIIDASYDEHRNESLLSVFVREFDRRMISKDRKGRLEAVELIRGLSRGDAEGEEEAMM